MKTGTIRRNIKTLKRTSVNELTSNNDAAKARVNGLQQQIQAKETELNALREMLARNDLTNTESARMELNRLQSAFDRVTKESQSRLEPVLNEKNELESQLTARAKYQKTLEDAGKQRDGYITELQNHVNRILAGMDSIDVQEEKETELMPYAKGTASLETQNDSVKRTIAIKKHETDVQSGIVEILKSELSKAVDAAERAERLRKKSQAEIDVVCARPVETVNDDWLLAQQTNTKLTVMLADAQRSIKFLSDKASELAQGNKETLDELSKRKEELIDNEKFLPNGRGSKPKAKGEGISRYDLTEQEYQSDVSDVVLRVAKNKTKGLKIRYDAYRKNTKEMIETINKFEDKLTDTNIQRENAEAQLHQALELRADLLSQKTFAEAELESLKQRESNQTASIQTITNEIESMEKELERQKTIIKLTEEIGALKTMDFQRFATTVSSVIETNKQLQ